MKISIYDLLADPWWLSVIRELQNMDHVFALLLLDILPRDVRHVLQSRSHCIVVVSSRGEQLIQFVS